VVSTHCWHNIAIALIDRWSGSGRAALDEGEFVRLRQQGYSGRRRARSLRECRVHSMCEDTGGLLFSREKRRSITQYWLHFVCKHVGFVNFQIIDALTGIVRPHPFVDRFSQSEGGIALSTHLLGP
jgi:hypothetical protein